MAAILKIADVIAAPGNVAIDANSSGDTYVIAPGVNVISESNDAFLARSQTHIYNYGGILSLSNNAVKFNQGGDLFNGGVATISGGVAGVAVLSGDSDPVSITNLGSILGGIGVLGDGISVGHDAGVTTIDNRGYLFGGLHGLAILTDDYDSIIINSGTVESNQDGIFVDSPPGVTITNTGTISGHVAAIRSLQGGINLTNSGHLIGDLLLIAASADTIVNTGSIAGTLHLGGGSDVFLGSGGSSGKIFGEAGGDHLTGGGVVDFLSGGADGDFLTGGAGRDHFVFDTAFAAAGIDRVIDFRHLVDKIDLSHAVFTATNPAGILSAAMFFAGPAAHDPSDRIIYTPANGWLTYDANGSQPGGATHFATLAAHLTLTSADFLVTA